MMLILTVSFVLAMLVQGGMCDAKKAQAALYTVLHDLALPTLNEGDKVTERFTLLEPGEILNYYDYTPLKDTPVFNSSRLPPDEAAFRLSDAVPSYSPFGGLSGNSLSTIYSNVLYGIDTSSIEDDPFKTQQYLAAMEYLQEKVSDPENSSAPNVSRSELYNRYKKHYYGVKLQVSQWIFGNRSSYKTENEYEDWYKESYPTLEAMASAAHSQWLVDGLKGQVEDKISIVDIKSVRSEIEAAKNLLQNEALPSMEGGSNYYPVEFIPSNWYEYLLAE